MPATRVDVLCQCGWGLLAIAMDDVPHHCPLCGFDLWAWAANLPLGQSSDERCREILDDLCEVSHDS